MDLRAYANGVILDFSRRGKPTDDEMIERAPARECLNGCCFPSLDDGQQEVDAFRGTAMSIVLTALSARPERA